MKIKNKHFREQSRLTLLSEVKLLSPRRYILSMAKTEDRTYHSPVIVTPLEDKWLCDKDEDDEANGESKHEMDVDSDPVAPQTSG